MKKITLTLLLLILLSSAGFATHNRAGYITYTSVPGSTNCLCDSFTLITYTRTSSLADRDSLTVNWGDGTSTTIKRAYKLGLDQNLYPDVSINAYYFVHCFPGPGGPYHVTMEDPNRNADVNNIPGSVNVPFFIETIVNIDPILGCDNSPEILNQPIDVGCVGEPYIYNPNAYDPDGDSLSYSLVPCRGTGGSNIVGFTEPIGSTSFTLNPVTGDLIWNNPRYNNSNPIDSGEWNVAILILEWRRNPNNGQYLNTGSVTLDMQITIHSCNNVPPTITIPPDTCVLAGSRIRFNVSATDIYNYPIDLSATGGPFEVSNPAIFNPIYSPIVPVNQQFMWQTDCDNIQRLPYTVTFKALDYDENPNDVNNPVDLTALATMSITVVSPAPQNLVDTPFGNTINLHWNPEVCQNAIGYKIYRKNGFYSDSIQCPCTVGVPPSTGFVFIAEVSGLNDTTFADNNNGLGLNHGIKYCYFITAFYKDSSESCASNQACTQLKKDSPIITNVSIDSTDVAAGRIYIAWSMPTQLDTNNSYHPPYQYKIYRSGGFLGSNLIQVGVTNLDTLLSFTDTTFVDTSMPPINTLDSAYSYRVDLYADDTLVNKSSIASSNYLSIAGADHTLNLSWHEQVGWTDTLYVIYRKDSITHLWDSIGISTSNAYADNNLPYHVLQSYYLKSIGYYTGTGYVYPIIDSSEIQSATPIDNIPPCSPIGTTVIADCVDHEDSLIWNNPNNNCSNYVAGYNIYYSPTNNNNFELLTTLKPASDTSYLYTNTQSIAGCFMVTAIDSGGLESKNPLQICVDNCPEYTLPNVFSPNGDGFNDIFHPFPYSYIRDIDIKIFDRWGLLVFQTSDPDINWDGKNGFSHKDCSDGVYYYICKVNAIHFNGVQTTTLKGFIELIKEK